MNFRAHFFDDTVRGEEGGVRGGKGGGGGRREGGEGEEKKRIQGKFFVPFSDGATF